MRRFFEAVAHALRARRVLATAAAVAIIAAALIIGGRGARAALVTAGAAGRLAGCAYTCRLAAQ